MKKPNTPLIAAAGTVLGIVLYLIGKLIMEIGGNLIAGIAAVLTGILFFKGRDKITRT